jgi:dihydroorotase
VRVPDDAAATPAHVTLTFADWKAGEVRPASYEFPIAEHPEPAATSAVD